MSSMNRAFWRVFKLMFIIILVMVAAIIGRTSAQDYQDYPAVSQTAGTQTYVCRNGFYKWIRLELHNAPAMIEYTSNGTDDTAFIGDILVFDAHQDDPAIDKGYAEIIDPTDYHVIASGDENTDWCAGTPGYVDPVTLATPFPSSSDPTCQIWAINGDTGGTVCIWNLPEPTNQ